MMTFLKLIVQGATLLLTFAVMSQVILLLYLQIKLKSPTTHLPPALPPPISEDTSPVSQSDRRDPIRTYYSERYFYQRGLYTVLTNYVQGTDPIPYFQTVTLVTHATVDFLDNVLLLVQFWSGPISLTVYAPGSDLELTLAQIAFYRQCPQTHIAHAISSRVSFHIFFETNLVPEVSYADPGTGLYGLRLPKVNCSTFSANENPGNFRTKKKLFFPINVARNIGQEESKSHFVLISDIELLPNPADLIPRFLDLIQRRIREGKWSVGNREVFVLPPFELSARVKLDEIPRTKRRLQEMLKGTRPLAVPFHYYACFLCHRIPRLGNWTNATAVVGEDGALDIFHSSPYVTTSAWEPFYIGSRLDPPFDERLFRENALNKVIQAAILCHSNYTFHILDKAFLVHKPGIKYGKTFKEYGLKRKGIRLAQTKILPLQFRLYGRRLGRCWQIASHKPI